MYPSLSIGIKHGFYDTCLDSFHSQRQSTWIKQVFYDTDSKGFHSQMQFLKKTFFFSDNFNPTVCPKFLLSSVANSQVNVEYHRSKRNVDYQ
jgi:hypothetical protein